MIKKIIYFFKYILETIAMGFYYLCLIVSKGFFFYFYVLVSIFGFVFRFPFVQKLKDSIKRLQGSPLSFLSVTLVFLFGVFFYVYLYSSSDSLVRVSEGSSEDGIATNTVEVGGGEEVGEDDGDGVYTDNNLYRKYGATKMSDINFNELKKVNPDVVAWLIVDSTNINYPIVQGGDNDYYLYHDINGVSKISGWTFMDYRNTKAMTDQNTIFYGHNLLNKTAFGSIANVFTDNWYQNSSHRIIVVTEERKYVYVVFSVYYIDPEVYYLQNNFSSEASFTSFIQTIKGRSLYNFGEEVSASDKIITLSTCTDDNKGRKVIHARLLMIE